MVRGTGRDSEQTVLTVENTALVLAGADLLDAGGLHANWRTVSLYVELGGRTYRDGLDLTPEEFYRRLRAGREFPRTSQPSPGDFQEAFAAAASSYERFLVVTPSARLSGTYDSARLAAELAGTAGVTLLDSGMVSGALVLLANALQRRLARGTTAEEALELAERFRDAARYVVVLETLEYVVRGGRASRVAGIAGEVMNVKPILHISGGEIVPLTRARGRARSLARLERIFADEASTGPALRVGVGHADAPEEAERLSARVRELRPEAELEFFGPFGPAVGAHSGPGAIALFWFADDG
jgi:DegV family protein with EDD domain